MQGLKVQADAEIDNVQAEIGRIQQCLNTYAEASARIRCIQDINSLEKELITTHNMACTPTFDLLDMYTKLLASKSSQLENEVADVRLLLDRFALHMQANEAARQDRCLKETHHHIHPANYIREVPMSFKPYQLQRIAIRYWFRPLAAQFTPKISPPDCDHHGGWDKCPKFLYGYSQKMLALPTTQYITVPISE
jgi:hypothetical protein